MKNHAVVRRIAAVAITVIASFALLGTGIASAAPTNYPPPGPTQTNVPSCTSQGNGLGVGGQDNGSCGFDDRSKNRNPNDNSKQTRTANTGFATLTASVIALALLGGGAALVVAGRRRRHG